MGVCVVITNAHSEVCFQCTLVFYAHPIPSPGLKNTYHRPCSACLIAVCEFHLPSMQIEILLYRCTFHYSVYKPRHTLLERMYIKGNCGLVGKLRSGKPSTLPSARMKNAAASVQLRKVAAENG